MSLYKENDIIKKSVKLLGFNLVFYPPKKLKGSVVHVTSRDTYINNKPVLNGLFDLKWVY